MKSKATNTARSLPLIAASLSLLLAACPGVDPGEKDGGSGDSGGGPIICSSDVDCPSDKPTCEGGICSAGSSACQQDSDCPSGSCNQLTGVCETCTDCCTVDTDCTDTGWTCEAGHCAAPLSPCTTAEDCEVDQICTAGNCAVWDVNAPCSLNTDCPRDHQCNSLGDARCEGCLNDAFCATSNNGPKCDVLDDGVGPGLGYCFPECGAGMPDCAGGFICDTSRGGLCVPACQTNADCQGGLVCRGGKCETCTTDAQCEATQLCSNGSCVDNPGCDDAQCQSSLGQAYFCDQATTSCRLGCSTAGCSGGINDCNPCPAGQTCGAIDHQCSGGTGCTACPTDCTALGQICDTVSCTCQSAGGGGCFTDAECAAGETCSGAIPGIIPGVCAAGCSVDTGCLCADPSKACVVFGGDPLLDFFSCLAGVSGTCQ